VAAFEKDFWQSNDEKQGGQNGTSSLDECVDAVAALDEQFMGMVVETATYLLEHEGSTKSLRAISSRVVDAISAVFSQLLARKVGVSEWVLQQEPACLGKLRQALLSAGYTTDEQRAVAAGEAPARSARTTTETTFF
jgi:hypothetical protein